MDNARPYRCRTAQGVYGSGIDEEGGTDDGNFGGYLSGYHLQYEFKNNSTTIMNVVILSFVDDSSSDDAEKKEDDLINRLDDAQTLEEDEDILDPNVEGRQLQIESEIRAWIEAECHSTFLDILAETKSGVESPSFEEPLILYDYLHSRVINLQLKTIEGKATVIRHGEIPPWPSNLGLGHPDLLPVRLPENKSFPVYLSTQVSIVDSGGLLQVTVDDSTDVLRCKLFRSERSATREHEAYIKLGTADLRPHIRIPKFRGYIKESIETGTGVIGLLIENINVEHSSLERAIGIYSHPDSRNQPPALVSIQRRQKWAQQIKETIQYLHDKGVVWGDAKPDNLMVDRKDDVWLVDFGGGFTEPWVCFEDSDSEQGDVNAMERMTLWLETGEEPRSSRVRDTSGITKAVDSSIDRSETRFAQVCNDPQVDTKERLTSKRKRDMLNSN